MPNERIDLVSEPYSKSLQESFNAVMPAGMPPLNIFRTIGNNERVLSRMVKGGLLDKGSISIAQRELVILRACALCNAEYEWGVHVAAYAVKAGFSKRQIADTCSEHPSAAVWTTEQIALIALVDELHQNANVSDELWAQLGEYFSNEQLIEILMLAGFYHAVSFVVNGLRVENEAFAARFPSDKT